MTRFVVLLSGQGSNLQAILDHIQTSPGTIEIVAVVSNKADVLGLTRAAAAGVPALTCPHVGKTKAAFEAQLIETIKPYKPDYLVLAGFMRVLSADFVAQFEGRILNIHPSLLPKYPGLDTHARALQNNDTHHGATVHVVTAALDGGPLIAQAQCPIEPTDTEASLQARVHTLEHILYPTVLDWIANGDLTYDVIEQRVFYKGQVLPKTGILIHTPQG